MQSSRLILRSNLGYNINNNHGSGGSSTYETYTPYIEIQWQRRWTEPGQFTVYMPYSEDAFEKAVLVTLEGREETGIITKRQIQATPNGVFLTLSGYFAEGMLKWGRRAREFTLDSARFGPSVARFIAELLTSYSSANRSNMSSLVEEGKEQQTGATSPTYYPILMHTEIGPVSNDTSSVLSSDEEYDTKTDPCDWLYSVLPATYSIRTYVFTKADYTSDTSDWRLMPGANAWFTKQDLNNISLGSTPAFVGGFKFKIGQTRSITFATDAGNAANIGLTIDETGCRSRSRAHLDSDVGWWSSSKPVERGILFTGDDGGYKYRAERTYKDLNNAFGYKSSDYGGSWKFGKMYATSDMDASVTKEVKSENASSLRTEMYSQAKLDMLNHWREETIEFEPIQTSSCQYLTHYDIGDQVTIKIANGTSYTARIVDIDEVHAKNHVEIKIRTGTPRRIKRK